MKECKKQWELDKTKEEILSHRPRIEAFDIYKMGWKGALEYVLEHHGWGSCEEEVYDSIRDELKNTE